MTTFQKLRPFYIFTFYLMIYFYKKELIENKRKPSTITKSFWERSSSNGNCVGLYEIHRPPEPGHNQGAGQGGEVSHKFVSI